MLPEQDAFIEAIYSEHFKKLMIYARAFLRDQEKAREIVQDVYHEAVLHIDVVMTHENPGGWLMKTLKNKLLEYERNRKKHLARFLSLDSEVNHQVASTDNAVAVIEAAEGKSVWSIVQENLTEEELYILRRIVLEGAPHLQVAKERNISVYASQKKLQRIREKLYKVFPERRKRK